MVGSGLGDREMFGLNGAGLGGSDCLRLSFSGLGFRVDAFDAVWDRVTARDLPLLGVQGGGFGKSPGNGLLLDPPLIYFIGQ